MKDRKNRAITKVRIQLRRLSKVIFGKIVVYEKMFAFETNAATARARCFRTENRAEVNVRLARIGDIRKLERARALFRRGKAEERLEKGHLCFVAEKDGNIANYVWVCFKDEFVDELERRIRIGPDSAYRYDGYTFPAYRGMGILPRVLVESTEYLLRNGVKEVYDLVTCDNFPSLRAHQKVGSRKMGEVTFIKLLYSKKYILKGETARDYVKLKQMLSS